MQEECFLVNLLLEQEAVQQEIQCFQGAFKLAEEAEREITCFLVNLLLDQDNAKREIQCFLVDLKLGLKEVEQQRKRTEKSIVKLSLILMSLLNRKRK